MDDITHEKLMKSARSKFYRLKERSIKLEKAPPQLKDIENVMIQSYNNGFKCYYCGKLLDFACAYPWKDTPSLEHMQPLTTGGDNNPNNLVLCCHECNIIKNTMNADTFIDLLDVLKDKPILKNKIFSESFNGKMAIKWAMDDGETNGCSHINPENHRCLISAATMKCHCVCRVDRGECPWFTLE